jgi:hypothetical protein
MDDLPKGYLTRDQLFELLRSHGFPIGRSTLDKLCAPAVNEGPRPIAFWPGHPPRPLYDAASGLQWARARLKPVAA